jgi:hypothetical protein
MLAFEFTDVALVKSDSLLNFVCVITALKKE